MTPRQITRLLTECLEPGSMGLINEFADPDVADLHIVKTLNHSDEVSGTSYFSDGTVAYWSEGRSSAIIYKLPDGKIVEIPSYEDSSIYGQLLSGDDYGEIGEMTPEQEAEYNQITGRETAPEEPEIDPEMN